MDVPQWITALRAHIHPYPETYDLSQYHELASDDDIDTFLQSDELWDSSTKQWKYVAAATSQDELQTGLRDVLASIISTLGSSRESEGTREACCVLDASQFLHAESKPTNVRSSPPLVIKASGPSFEVPDPTSNERDLGYTNVASCVSVALEEWMNNDDVRNTEESSVYAW